MKTLITLALLVPFAASAQTVIVPALTSPLPAVVQPAITLSCPITGKTATCKIPQQTILAASQTSTKAITVAMPAYTWSITLTPAQAQAIQAALTNGGGTVTGIALTLTPVKP